MLPAPYIVTAAVRVTFIVIAGVAPPSIASPLDLH